MIRRIMLTRVAALLATGALATGCVTQSVPEGALESGEDLGVVAAPLEDGEARRVVLDSRTSDRTDGRQVADSETEVATAGEVGLVRDPSEPAPPAGDRDAKRPAKRAGAGGSGSKSGTGGSGGGGSGGGSTGGGSTGGGSGGQGSTGGSGPAKPAQPTGAARFATLADVADPEGDAKGDAPAYADVRRVLVESDGTTARVSVAFAGRLPASLDQGEVQGVGVDFWHGDTRESDYQLFADGGSTGWEAFLHTPGGIVRYPGEFRMGGRVLVFEVPWSALGGARRADFSVFVDWSRQRRVLNDVGSDRAPDRGRAALRH